MTAADGEGLAGHEDAWRAWLAAQAGERMHHAWLLAGPRGLGKRGFATAAAAHLVAEPQRRQPAPEAHPDILAIEPLPDGDEEARKSARGDPFRPKRSISVDQIRLMQRRLTTRPTLGSRRVVIVDAADNLEKAAANALLKSLEEPPQGSSFLLVAHQPGRLLPTIRSRCRVLRFAAWNDGQVDALLRRERPDADADTRAAAIIAARGSPGLALDFVTRAMGPALAIMRRLIVEGDADLALRGALATAIGPRPERERLMALIDLARALLLASLPVAVEEGGSTGPGLARQAAIIAAHAELVRITAQAPTYNFDPGLLTLEIGRLLASIAMARSGAAPG